MAIKTYNDQNFVAIANAIRAKNGETTQYKPSEMAAAISALETALELLPQDTVAGAIANFPDGSNNYPVVELIANIDPKQAGSGDPSPSNVRPISGSTECNISKQGKNLFDVGTSTSDYEDYSKMESIVNGVISMKILSSGSTFTYRKQDIYIKGLVTFSATTSKTYSRFFVKLRSKDDSKWLSSDDITILESGWTYNSYYQGWYCQNSSTQAVKSITIPEACLYWRLGVGYGNQYTVVGDIETIENIQIEVGSTATDYEPYSAPEVKTISWESEAGTVYIGTLNVTTGELTVDYGLTTLTEAQINSATAYSYQSKNGISIVSALPENAIRTNAHFCSHDLVKRGADSASHYLWFGSTSGSKAIYWIGILDDLNKTLAEFKEWAKTQTIQLCFMLPTPQTYQLTPEEVKTLLGVNNIYTDTGDVDLTYRADIDLYIAKKIAEGA